MRPIYVIIMLVGLASAVPARAQNIPPSPDIFLVGMRPAGGSIALTGVVKNVTAREGYDNQPAWTRDGKSFYYTSVRDDGQADIYSYDLETGAQTRVTRTAPESEYSATPTPDGQAISVIRVERDSTQRIWRLPLGGGTESVVLPALKPAGYQAWLGPRSLAVFVLGSPNALAFADVGSQQIDTVARDIGRSLHRIPGTSHLSFSQRVSATESWVMAWDPATRQATRRARLPESVEDYAWTPSGTLIAGSGSTLLAWDGERWQVLGDLGAHGLTGITRLAVSPGADWIAVVAVPAAAPR